MSIHHIFQPVGELSAVAELWEWWTCNEGRTKNRGLGRTDGGVGAERKEGNTEGSWHGKKAKLCPKVRV